MQNSILRWLLISSLISLQAYSWKAAYPAASISLRFPNRSGRSLFNKTDFNQRIQSFLTPARTMKKPQNIRQRRIRDLMTRLMVNNHRVPMISPASFKRQPIQRVMPRPTSSVHARGVNPNLQYRQAFALPSNSMLHALSKDPRAHRMVLNKPTLIKPNQPVVLRPQLMHHRAPIRSSGGRKQPNIVQVYNGAQRMPISQTVRQPQQQISASLETALADILSSSASSNRIRSQNQRNKVEVIHHMPVNPSPVKTSRPAVVYISKPKNGIQVPQTMYMKNVGQSHMLAADQSKLIPNIPFKTGERQITPPKSSGFKQNVPARNNGVPKTRFAPQPVLLQQITHMPHIVPTSGPGFKTMQQNSRNKAVLNLSEVYRNVPRPQVLRGAQSPAIRQNIPQTFVASATALHNKVPKINRLKAELNAEIEELLKHVPRNHRVVTAKPKLTLEQKIPHPFLIPQSLYKNKLEEKEKLILKPEIPQSIKYDRIPEITKSNSANRHTPVPLSIYGMQKHHVKIQAVKPINSVSTEDFDLNQRRPVVTEQTVNSEELEEILKSFGYQGDTKILQNVAEGKPIKLIISNHSDEKNPSIDKEGKKTVKFVISDQSEQKVSSMNDEREKPMKFVISNQSDEKHSSVDTEGEKPVKSVISDQSEGKYPIDKERIKPAKFVFSDQNDERNPIDKERINPVKFVISDQSGERNPIDKERIKPAKFDISYQRDERNPIDKERITPAKFVISDQSYYKQPTLYSAHSQPEDNIPLNSDVFKDSIIEEHKIALISGEDFLLNKSTTFKNYWDFRKENDKLQSPVQKENDSGKIITLDKGSELSLSKSNYQGEEPIASISFKEEFPIDEKIKSLSHLYTKQYSKPFTGTLHEIYNKQIHKDDDRSSHFVPYFPKRLIQPVPAVESTSPPSHQILVQPVTIATNAYGREVSNKNAKNNIGIHAVVEIADHGHKIIESSKFVDKSIETTTKSAKPIKYVRKTEVTTGSPIPETYLPKLPKVQLKRIIPSFKSQDKQPTLRATVIPKLFKTNNRHFYIDSFQISTPKYSITKATTRRPFANRKWLKKENGLIPKYILPGREQINNENSWTTTPIYVISEKPRINPTTPSSLSQNFRFQNFKPELTTPLSLNVDYTSTNQFENQEKSNTAVSLDIVTTTEVPFKTTQTTFERKTSEFQNENTQEVKHTLNESEIFEASETVTANHKQYFRGPQHNIMFEEISADSHQDIIRHLIPYTSTTTTLPSVTTLNTAPKFDPIIQLHKNNKDQHSNHSQTNAFNQMDLAINVFGRKNRTSFRQLFPTRKTPEFTEFRHKFTYAPIVKTSTAAAPVSSSGKRIVFNFRTGTTQSISQASSSAVPKIIHNSSNRMKFGLKSKNDTLDFTSTLKEDDKIISSNAPKNVFQHVVFSQPNIAKKRFNHSTVTESTKDLYGILKPITKPYNVSMTPLTEMEQKKVGPKIFKFPINSTTKYFTSTVSTILTASTTNITPESTLPTSQYTTTYSSKGITYPKVPPTTQYIVSEIPAHNNSKPVDKNASWFSETDILTEASVRIEDRRIKPKAEANTTDVAKGETLEVLDQEQMVVDSLKSMQLKMQEMASKGLRHLMPLVMELSSDVSISSDCTFSLLRWLRAVRTGEQWAIRMMDASSKIPEGILYGTFSTFGSYDECIAIKTPKANLQMPYTGLYCSINIQPILPPSGRHFTIQNAFRKYPKLKQVFQEMNIEEDTMAYYYILKHRIGICMPSTCNLEDLGNVTEKLADQLKMKISVERCETAEKPSLTRGQVVSMCGVFIAFGIVILATIIDVSMRFKSKHEMDIDEIIRKKNGLRQFSYVFSAYGNACKILNTSVPTTHLSSLHGIKFLSITWVMLGHVYYCKDYLTLAGLNKVRDLGSNLAFQVVLNSAFAADTFFFLSGLLVVYSTFLYLENSNGRFTIVGFYIRRYCRLTPAFLMISGVILLGPLAGSGPIWHETLEPFVSGCQNYWWTNLFYFSNFMPTDKTCVPHGWFLSCDMQFYIIAPIIILALYRRPKLGILLITLGLLSSMITTGTITFLYSLPPVSLFSLPDPKDINEYLNVIGYKPYAHYASYCVGMATGFLLAAKQKISISKCLRVFGWVASTVGCCLVLYGTWNWNSGNLPNWPVSVAYATTSRTVWCLGVAWLTVVCYAGHGGPINIILSWHGFIPLSRLSYLAYLIHPLLMYLYASYMRSPFYFSQYVVVYLYLGHLCVTFGLAFIFSLAFELPFLNLEKVVTKYLDRSKRKRRASFSNHHNNWQHPEHPELKDAVVLMRRRADKFLN